MRSLLWLALGGVGGCLPVQQSISVVDTPLSSRVETERGAPALTGQITSDAAGISIDLESHATCRERTIQTVRRLESHRREGLGPLIAFEYLLGAASLGAGGFIVYDSHTNTRTFDVGTPEQSAHIGYAVAGLGLALATLAIVESVRVRDRIVVREPVDVKQDAREVACGEGPAAGTVVQLVVGRTPVVLGTTDGKGHLHATWDVLPEHTLDGERAPTKANVVAVDAGKANLDLGAINLVAARIAIAERAWQDAKGAATRLAVSTFRTRFPDVHPGEATSLLGTLFARDVEAALGGGQAGDARKLVDEWAALDRTSPALATLRLRVDDLQHANDLAARWQAYAARITAAKQEVTASELVALAKELDALLATDPEHAPGAAALRDELSVIRRDAIKRLVGDAEKLRRDGQADIALRLVAHAATIDPAARETTREGAKIRAEIVTKGSVQVRQLIRAKDNASARRVLARLETLVPDDAQLIRLRTELERAEARETARAQKKGTK